AVPASRRRRHHRNRRPRHADLPPPARRCRQSQLLLEGTGGTTFGRTGRAFHGRGVRGAGRGADEDFGIRGEGRGAWDEGLTRTSSFILTSWRTMKPLPTSLAPRPSPHAPDLI